MRSGSRRGWVADRLASGVTLIDEERDLVMRARAGDRNALGKILLRYSDRLLRAVLLPKLLSMASAEDALSETVSRVVEHIGRFEWTDRGIYPWLKTIATHVAFDELRRRRRLIVIDPAVIQERVEEGAHQASTESIHSEADEALANKRRIERALEALHPRYRDVIVARILNDEPRTEVAKRLGVSEATFDVLLHRALKAMKKVMEEDGEGT